MVNNMEVSQIVAIGIENEMGKDNDLLCHLKTDLKRFKSITMDHCMLMGRKTFESIKAPLNGRISIVVTRDKNYSVKNTNNVFIVHSVDEGIELASNLGEKNLMVIGGSEIFYQTLDVTDKIYLTKIWKYFSDADTFYPEDCLNDFKIIKQKHNKPSVTGDNISYTFFDLLKK